jgi:capsular polysaccharide biosynthesis protein
MTPIHSAPITFLQNKSTTIDLRLAFYQKIKLVIIQRSLKNLHSHENSSSLYSLSYLYWPPLSVAYRFKTPNKNTDTQKRNDNVKRYFRHIIKLLKLGHALHRGKETKQETGPSIQMIKEAIIQPRNRNFSSDGFLEYDDGVFFPTGDPVSLAKHWRGHRYLNSPVYRSVPARHQEGNFIFGGWLFGHHFGHCVMESLGRLWANKYLNCGLNTFLFLPGFGIKQTIPDFFREILRNLGVEGSIEIVREPVSVDRLFVPSQLFGMGWGDQVNPEFLEFVHQLRHCDETPEAPMDERRKIYVSRSRLPKRRGGILCERRLDELFRRSGYEVVHPELLTIDEQIRIYTGAGALVFSEGSAVHFYAFLARPDQRVAIVARRPNQTSLQRQISNFGGSDAVTLSNINYLIVPDSRPGRRHPEANAHAAIDFEAVGESLVRYGFIDSAAEWCNPGETELRSEIRQMERAVEGDVRIRWVSGGVSRELSPEPKVGSLSKSF